MPKDTPENVALALAAIGLLVLVMVVVDWLRKR